MAEQHYRVSRTAVWGNSPEPSRLRGMTVRIIGDASIAAPDPDGDVYAREVGGEEQAYVRASALTPVGTVADTSTTALQAALVALGSDLDASRLLAVAAAIEAARS